MNADRKLKFSYIRFVAEHYHLFPILEVRGVEPLSETESTKLLRVYGAFDLGSGTPTSGLIRNHPLDSAPLNERAEPPQAWPAKLCLGAQQTSALRHRGR